MASSVSYQENTWLKFYQKSIPENYSFKNICMPYNQRYPASTYQNKPDSIFKCNKINFAQFKSLAHRFIACMSDIGVRIDDIAALLLSDFASTVVSNNAIHATQKIYSTIKATPDVYQSKECIDKYQLNMHQIENMIIR